jgi:hypothetical protein
MISIIEKTENKLEILYSKHIVSLVIICAIGFFLRLYFTRFDFPLESQDAFLYLVQAQQITQGKFEGLPVTSGWQFFLSLFFRPFNFENNLGYMQILRLVSISVSVVTIPIVYALGRKFLEKRYAILASAFFAFEPNLIENSIFGITEPLFIFCGVLAIFFVFYEKPKYIFVAAIFAGLALDIRINGIVLFIIITIACFIDKTPSKQKIKKFLIFLIIFTVAASPFFILNYQLFENPLGSFLLLPENISENVAPSIDASQIDNNLQNKFMTAISEEFKHIFRISVPYLALFVPFGIVVSLLNFDYKKKIIFLTIITSLIIAIPQYTLSIEYRNLFFILPMFSVIGAFGIQHLMETKPNKNLFLLMIIIGIIFLSVNMLRERNDIDLDLLKEKEMFGKYVVSSLDGKIMGDVYTQIAHNLPNARIVTEGPGNVRNDDLVLIGFGPPSKTILDLMNYAKQHEITHMVIDDNYEARSPQFVDVYFNEEKYPYLKKVFDSDENGYKKLHVKVFKIDYSRLE